MNSIAKTRFLRDALRFHELSASTYITVDFDLAKTCIADSSIWLAIANLVDDLKSRISLKEQSCSNMLYRKETPYQNLHLVKQRCICWPNVKKFEELNNDVFTTAHVANQELRLLSQ